MAPGKASATARERARASLTADIKEESRRQLAAVGADALSLRAVARELGMVSSALYRYFPSKDDLLTALIIDAYDAVGEVAETAVRAAGAGSPRARWLAACHAIRGWALAHPHEYALIYGSPVPGYRAPEATIGPASRVPLALISVLGDVPGGRSGGGGAGEGGGGGAGAVLAGQAAAVAAALSEAVRPDVLLRGVLAWAQVFGMISFELFGQFARTFEPADELFTYAVVQMAQLVGLLSVLPNSAHEAAGQGWTR